MEQSSAVWLLIGLALITANLPFVLQRPLLALPWTQKGEPARPAALRWLESLVFFALLYGVARLAYHVIADTLVMSSDLPSVALFYAKIAAYVVVIAVLMLYPGWRTRGHAVEKSVLARLIELFVLYLMCGVLAFALELNLGNRFVQTWEFYAVTGSLFVVLGYPAFVYRYLMRKPKPARKTALRSSGGTSSAQRPAG